MEPVSQSGSPQRKTPLIDLDNQPLGQWDGTAQGCLGAQGRSKASALALRDPGCPLQALGTFLFPPHSIFSH